MIRIEDLTKTYRIDSISVKALQEINMTVSAGEFVAIIGPSGSGKSTLMNIIGCLDVPTSGRYWLNGRETGRLTDNQLAEIRNRTIGFVFQSFNLLPRLSALENVERPLVYRGVSGRERVERAKCALERVGLGDRMLHRPTQLSGGQQQRVAIARALVGEPLLILADEPTGNLDSNSGRDILNIIRELHNQGKTIVLITHDMDVARKAERIVRIQDGRIVGEEGGTAI